MYQRSKPRGATGNKLPPQPPPAPRPQQSELASMKTSHTRSVEEDREDRLGQAMHMEGVYIISVAARLLDVHPQTLRKYERLGLIRPGRTIGMLRLYSGDDIRKVRLIQHLADNLGLNLAGVEFALGLVDNLLALRQRLAAATEGTHLHQAVEQEVAALFRSMDLPLED